jgi:hypothetical protein
MIFSAIKEQKLISGEKVMKFPYVGVPGDELCFVRYRDENGQDCEAFCERGTLSSISCKGQHGVNTSEDHRLPRAYSQWVQGDRLEVSALK